MQMIDPNFDPYLELQEVKLELLRQQKTIKNLIIGHNHNQELIQQLTDQSRQLIELIRQLQDRQHRLS